ncbi:IQ-DOMAIN 5-RELATED [Salix koriyanagi]|uniref:IQ-DOMAIN 5-RELATED n=1 Tax=Salix koriyanagi TaxID=2511006 RepID=A0A9Q0U5F6_9ROSI|nr:IQ-DOMAIN 5-RELATED [Salix koriyanagi]
MGITGELVRGVFSRNRSVGTHESNGRIAPGDHKKRWSSVRLYLCGEELNSVLAEEDSASVKSSEATVTQPVLEDSEEKGDVENEGAEEDMPKEKHNSTSKLFRQEDAAITIQSAFRDFLVCSDRLKYHYLDYCRKMKVIVVFINRYHRAKMTGSGIIFRGITSQNFAGKFPLYNL